VGHLHDLKRAWDRIRVRAGIHNVRFHDLRRTVGSWLAASGESLHLIGKVLNHRDVSTTAIYAR
jgi:integrase